MENAIKIDFPIDTAIGFAYDSIVPKRNDPKKTVINLDREAHALLKSYVGARKLKLGAVATQAVLEFLGKRKAVASGK